MGRVLALDVGDRRIGVALSDPTGLLAFPLTTILRGSRAEDLAAILELAQQHDAEKIVVGVPVSLDGQLHHQGKKCLAFARALQQQTLIPVETWDERFSTSDAEELLRQRGEQPSRQKARLDAAAAAVILQSYLEARREKDSPEQRI